MVIIVEEEIDKIFIESYLNYLKPNTNSYECHLCKGKDNLQSVKNQLQIAINKKGEKIKIIFDADEDLNQAKENIKKQLNDMGFSI